MREIAVIVEAVLTLSVRMAHPASDMALVDGDRGLVLHKRFLLLHPRAVCPLDRGDVCDHGSSSRSLLSRVCIGICLI